MTICSDTRLDILDVGKLLGVSIGLEYSGGYCCSITLEFQTVYIVRAAQAWEGLIPTQPESNSPCHINGLLSSECYLLLVWPRPQSFFSRVGYMQYCGFIRSIIPSILGWANTERLQQKNP